MHGTAPHAFRRSATPMASASLPPTLRRRAKRRPTKQYSTILTIAQPSNSWPKIELPVLHIRSSSRSRDLQLASLFQPDLSRWNITRTELIDTAATQYLSTVRWALAIHRARPDLQGMTWTSRRCDPDCAYILFGDRLAPGDFDVYVSPGH